MNIQLKKYTEPLFQKSRYPALDGLRSLAILMVFITHTAQHTPGLSFHANGHEWLSLVVQKKASDKVEDFQAFRGLPGNLHFTGFLRRLYLD